MGMSTQEGRAVEEGTLAIFDKYTNLANPLVVSDGQGSWSPVKLSDLAAYVSSINRSEG